MSKLLIKITDEPGDTLPHRTVGGVSGRDYLFLFNKPLGAYVYEPKDDFEISDIFDLVRLPNFPWRFAPALVEGEPGNPLPKFVPPPVVTPDKYAQHTHEELVALCADCGFRPWRDTDTEAVRAQLAAYFLGRGIVPERTPAKEPPVPGPHTVAPAPHTEGIAPSQASTEEPLQV